MKTFAAIDFETANNSPTSVCSVGVVVVKNGIVAEKFYELIRPTPNFYNYWNTGIHGMSIRDTADAPEFPQVWQKIMHQITRVIAPQISPHALQTINPQIPFVAHNSPFDEGCLRAVHAHYDLHYPAYRFHCTCRLSRKAFPHLPNHKLHTVARHVGFDLTNHHHALADAEACATIALALETV